MRGVTEKQYIPRNGRGGGTDIVHEATAPNEQMRFWIDNDNFPRVIIDVPNGQILVGNGTAPPTPLSGGGGGGASTADHFVTYATDADLTNNKILGNLFRADVIANRGAFGTAGQIFFGTDTLLCYLDTGAAWVTMTALLSGGVFSSTVIPNLDFSKITTGTVPIGQGGTGQTTQQAALDAVAGAVTNNRVLAGNGTHVTLRALAAADLPNTAVTPATYGDGTHVGQFTVDAQGRLTAAANVAITGGGSDHLGLTPTALKTAAYSALVGDLVRCDVNTTGSFTVTLPAAPADGSVVAVTVATPSTGRAVTVARGGADTIGVNGGVNSFTLSVQDETVILQYLAASTVWVVAAVGARAASLDSRYLQAANNLTDVANNNTSLNNLLPAQTSNANKFLKTDGTNTSWATPAGGGGLPAITSKTANYTATTSDNVIECDASGGAFTITLFAAAAHAGQVITVKKIDSSANAVTIDANASELIDGALTLALITQYNSVTMICDGTGWAIV